MRKIFHSIALAAMFLASAGSVQAAMAPVTPGGGGGTRHATVTVVTNVVNDNGGTLLPAGVLMTYGDGLSTLSTFAGYPAPGFTLSVAPGTYQVEGADVAGYTRTYSAGCSGTLVPDGFASCVVTYDDVVAPCVLGNENCTPPAPPSNPCPAGYVCNPPTPPCVLGSENCTPPAPPGGNPPGTSTTDPSGSSSTTPSTSDEELPRTGGSPVPEALVFAALGIALSFRKRS